MDSNSLSRTAAGHIRTPYGVSKLQESAADWQTLVRTTGDVDPRIQQAMLDVQRLWPLMALRTLRDTVTGSDTMRLCLQRPSPKTGAGILRPTKEDVRYYTMNATDRALAQQADFEHLVKASPAELAAFGKATSRVARLHALQADAREELDDNIASIGELMLDYVSALSQATTGPTEHVRTASRQATCQTLEEILALAARSMLLLEGQTRRNDPDHRRNSLSTIREAMQELLQYALQRRAPVFATRQEQEHFLREAQATFDLFTGKHAGGRQ